MRSSCARTRASCATSSSERHMLPADRAMRASATCATRRPVATAPTRRSRSTINAPFGIGLGHNGNLTNAAELRGRLVAEDRRHLNTRSDSEVLLNVLRQRAAAFDPRATGGGRRVRARSRACSGAAAAATPSSCMIVGHGIVGFRDPHGIRPLVLGKRETRARARVRCSRRRASPSTCWASRSSATSGRARRSTSTCTAACTPQRARRAGRHTPCIFEIRVFRAARLDHRQHLRATRRACAWAKARREDPRALRPDHDIDVVIPIPDTSRTERDAGRAAHSA